MNLVAYSDSEGSDDEIPQISKAKPMTANAASKSSFQKVVDRSNPHKIKVNLPSTSSSVTEADEIEAEAPPSKKARTGGGAFSGFSSFLPAPKKASGNSGGAISRGLGRGLGRGVNLKTGAAPAFSREPAEEAAPSYPDNEDDGVTRREPLDEKHEEGNCEPQVPVVEEVKLVGKATRFVPMSVSKKAQKKKKTAVSVPSLAAELQSVQAPKLVAETKPPPKPKISLFSMAQSEEIESDPAESRGAYVPLLQEHSQDAGDMAVEETQQTNATLNGAESYDRTIPSSSSGPQSLDQIASDLNLSEAARRQLFGRQRGNNSNQKLSAINVINFNTDAEYAANEELRAKGETVQHNPVRAIAPGKHSLQQLVNAASTQREALEEHFASGKRNKKEAGSKYGW